MDLFQTLAFRGLLINLLLILKVNGLQQFLEKPQDTSIIKGRTATLKCSVENRQGQIQWAKNGLMLGYSPDIPGFQRYSVIRSNAQEFNLQIENADLSDDADFQCQVGPAENNPPLLAEAHLTVLVPPNMPQIIGYPNGSTVNVLYSEPVLQLTCEALLGRPAASIKWFRNGVEVTSDVVYTKQVIDNDKRENANSVLTLHPRYPDDNGVMYECRADNEALISGPLRMVVVLSVQYPPGQPMIEGYKRNQAIHINDTVHMICTSEGGNPLAEIAWFLNGVRVDSSYTQRDNRATNDLTLKAQQSDNDAQYECHAWNVVNSDAPLVVRRKLVVYFAPRWANITGTREAKAGETLTLTCQTSNSNPPASITWIPMGPNITKEEDQHVPSPEGGFVTISVITVTLSANQGQAIYTCSASNNALGITVADNVHIGILYRPDNPVITGYTEGDSIRVGQIVRMICRATGGNPPATLTWTKGDVALPATEMTIGNIPALEVAVVTTASDNNALYKCNAINRAIDKPLEVTKKLTVHFPPANVSITSNPRQGRAGHRLNLTCMSAESNPAAVLTWIHDGLPATGRDLGSVSGLYGGEKSKSVLEFIPTANDHKAVYGCKATNIVLQEVTHNAITLDVLYKPVFKDKEAAINIEMGSSRVIDLTASANPSTVTYNLLRNGTTVTSAVISSFTLVDGVLTVSGIGKTDNGPFTIIAENSEGVTSFNFTINVLYPATITDGGDVEGELTKTAVLTCVANGNPLVDKMITWKRDNFDFTRTLNTYQSDGLQGTGRLTVYNLEKTDSGTFTCIADNKVGAPSTRDINLTVKFKPVIDRSREFSKAASETGKTGRLVCRAEGAPTVTFRWQKDGIPVDLNENKYLIDQKIVDPEKKIYENILMVKNVQPTDYATYECIVNNEKGEDRFKIAFENTTKPDVPYNIEFVNATHNSVTLKWKKGFNGGLDQSFRVRYREVDSNVGYTHVDVLPKNSTIFTVRGLALGTQYELTVMSYNDLGGSDYQSVILTARTSNLKPAPSETDTGVEPGEDTPVIIILIVCVLGIFLLALNIGLILFFVRRRNKRMANGSDTTSHTNTIELYGPSKETALYPMTPSDESRSYGTYDKNHDDDFSDDYKSYEHEQQLHHHHQQQHPQSPRPRSHTSAEDCICLQVGKATWKDNCCFNAGDEDLKRVFLPPPEYVGVTYSHNKMDSPTYEHRHPVHTDVKYPYNGSDTDSCRKSPWVYEDPYKSRGKGTFDSDYMDNGHVYEPNGRIGGRMDTRPKSVTDMSERSSRPSSRGAPSKTPPPPPVRSSSKGAADIPPLPARNYGSQDLMPRYGPLPGSQSSAYNNNVNVIANPNYEGPPVRTPSPRHLADPDDDMRGHLV